MSFVCGKVALVTGGGNGIGFGIIQALLEAGAQGVTILDKAVERNRGLLDLKSAYGDKVLYVEGDVTRDDDFKEAFDRTIEIFKNIDIVINNAGVNEQDWNRTMEVNLIAVIRGTELAMKHYLTKYRSSDQAAIVNIASIAGLDVQTKFIPYTVSKHGVVGLGKVLSEEAIYEKTGIRVLTICPGAVDTNMFRATAANLSGFVGVSTPHSMGVAIIKLVNEGRHGVWVIEDDEPPYEVEFPFRKNLRKGKST